MISNTDNTIDSRDVIARIEELEALRRAVEECPTTEYLEACKAVSAFDESDEGQELIALNKLQEQAEDSPDWTHGETLINELYFTDYIKERADGCYNMSKELNSGDWPWRHMKIAKVDYMEVDFDGVTFLIRA